MLQPRRYTHFLSPHLCSLGYVVDEQDKLKATYRYLQEFISYIVNRDFINPRLSHLCDIHLWHPSPLDLGGTGLYIRRVNVSSNESG